MSSQGVPGSVRCPSVSGEGLDPISASYLLCPSRPPRSHRRSDFLSNFSHLELLTVLHSGVAASTAKRSPQSQRERSIFSRIAEQVFARICLWFLYHPAQIQGELKENVDTFSRKLKQSPITFSQAAPSCLSSRRPQIETD